MHELHGLLRQARHVRRLNIGIAVGLRIPPAVIIGEKENDIRPVRFALGSGCCFCVFGDQRACREAGEQHHGDAIECVA